MTILFQQFSLLSQKEMSNGKRKNLGTFNPREAAQKHEKAVQFFKWR
jgi:hypothetical protein